MSELSAAQWDSFLGRHPQAHLLQSAAWGELKAVFGWSPIRIGIRIDGSQAAGAQILLRDLPFGLRLAYLPKGPVGSAQADWTSLWAEIDRICRQRHVTFLLAEPDAWQEQVTPAYAAGGFAPTTLAVQPPRTILVDLTGSEDDLLGRMKQKTRYNVRLAAKKDITVSASADLETFSRLMSATGERDGFGVHTPQYYRTAYNLFHPSAHCELFLASYQGQALAGLLAFRQGECAWYLYGASSDAHRERMPAYLLQWQAMLWARQHGCIRYDLWGVPDENEDVLEAGFETRSDGLWGVYRFKRGFGGQVLRSAPAQVRRYRPTLYRLVELAIRRGWGGGL